MKRTLLFCGLWLWSVVLTQADLYQWTDSRGILHVVDDLQAVPEEYRGQMQTHSTPKTTAAPKESLLPRRSYPPKSQGAFAQKLARDLGLIKSSTEDGVGPLGAAGIQPASSWRVAEPLTEEAQDEVAAAARRAAMSQRLALSADGAEAVVRQTAKAFLPPPPPPAPPVPSSFREAPEIFIEQQPPQIIEIIREPYYVHDPYGPLYGPLPPRPAPPAPPKHGPQFATPAPTHMPFGASHMPFGSKR